ncbi:L-lactate dehydrogenase [Thioclava sp. SK-1]|nr:L-lactate dehydrogenase [Thioclava sp. SK-1]OCX66196.1 L-lactate dehydrogenase [Thioclava sp. SK-1]
MKVGIVGAGMVGSAAGYALALRGGASQILFVDHNHALAVAQAADIAHAVPFAHPCQISAGDYAGLSGAHVVILAAGVAQKPGESRLSLLTRNVDIFADVVGQVRHHAPKALLLVASNPVDIMTQVALRASGLPTQRVIGSGTILDTARFRWLLAQHLGVSPHSVHGYVLGEHGDSEVLTWSSAQLGSTPIVTAAAQLDRAVTPEIMARIDTDVRCAAYKIIVGKGATYYGIGAGLARICQALRDDQRAVFTCSIQMPQAFGVENIALSLPRVIGAQGIVNTLQLDLSETEHAAMRHSAQVLHDTAAAVL